MLGSQLVLFCSTYLRYLDIQVSRSSILNKATFRMLCAGFLNELFPLQCINVALPVDSGIESS